MTTTPSLIVHGGAWQIPEEDHPAHIAGVRAAAKAGWQMLEAGQSALDVVEVVVRALEDDPAYDAGRGSHLNSAGHIEMDALIMDGRTLESGAVAAVQCIQHPISLARLVMTETEHSLLVGIGAQAFAEQMGIPRLPEEELLVGRELERWKEWQKNPERRTRDAFKGPVHGTVGAVARDIYGNLAAATSTGGTPNKMSGRVGDSPLIGCGAYADNLTGAASATGHGESLMKLVVCKTACDLMGTGLTAQEAADEVIRRLSDKRIDGLGGVITIDREGRTGCAFNTPHMARAVVRPDGTIVAAVDGACD
ncbi:MAG TPA: isoaspartyl peptidase/L-asparaginase [Aggregatilineales bacterium]|nr:peptidase T [Chloroflexota bacterium]HOA23494.1 isoaspartyl peptidase/L-asparaginase [Aggregatilineales bacterium]HPV06504.1 isoaspartyl peptidase/L-asparaginase [Aggregatilineales bacterium]HQA68473.1 isoaspartyl peptidase/L-asparaginase [Aggregatilineales bacterium]HQE18282.1 isoaspartyl peptidase/L-asparaginase [Aggregatilineales bacterium]